MSIFNTLLTNGGESSGLDGFLSYLPIIFLGGLLIVFLVISNRQQKKKDQEIKDMRSNLSVGDEVTTVGGIIGKIVSIKDETCVIVTSRDNTKIRILKSAIATIDVSAADSKD